MRLINDRTQKEETSEVDFSSVLLFCLLIPLGYTTVILAPLPVILAYKHMSQPWPRLCAIIGGVISSIFLNLPVPLSVCLFTFSLFVADGIWREGKFWTLLFRALGLAAALSVILLLTLSVIDGVGAVSYWGKIVESSIAELNRSLNYENKNLEILKGLLFYEGPFLILSFALISVWLSIGLCAHLRWLPESHPLSGQGLRRLRLSPWASGFFMISFLSVIGGLAPGGHILSGTMHLLSSLMFVYGSIFLSRILNERQVGRVFRTLAYSISLILGFYVLIGAGALAPWFKLNSVKEQK